MKQRSMFTPHTRFEFEARSIRRCYSPIAAKTLTIRRWAAKEVCDIS
jgi:hypothetical protein